MTWTFADREHTQVKLTVNGIDYVGPYPVRDNGEWRRWTDDAVAALGEPSPYQAPVIPPFVPPSISDRQFYQRLAMLAKITTHEALAAVQTGAIPATLQAFVDAIPDDVARFNVQMLLSGATTFERDHPLTPQVGAFYGFDAAGIDQFFRDAATL